MGQPNSGLGYQGIRNAIAIEFDTWCVGLLLNYGRMCYTPGVVWGTR